MDTRLTPLEEEVVDARRQFVRDVTGSMNTRRSTPIPVRIGPAPPSWWDDDDEASESSMQAMRDMATRG